MKIIHRLFLGFFWVILLIWFIGYFAVYTGQRALQKSNRPQLSGDVPAY